MAQGFFVFFVPDVTIQRIIFRMRFRAEIKAQSEKPVVVAVSLYIVNHRKQPTPLTPIWVSEVSEVLPVFSLCYTNGNTVMRQIRKWDIAGQIPTSKIVGTNTKVPLCIKIRNVNNHAWRHRLLRKAAGFDKKVAGFDKKVAAFALNAPPSHAAYLFSVTFRPQP